MFFIFWLLVVLWVVVLGHLFFFSKSGWELLLVMFVVYIITSLKGDATWKR